MFDITINVRMNSHLWERFEDTLTKMKESKLIDDKTSRSSLVRTWIQEAIIQFMVEHAAKGEKKDA